ncbi:MAG: alkaline phosphatase [Candidatus Binatia bacterium]
MALIRAYALAVGLLFVAGGLPARAAPGHTGARADRTEFIEHAIQGGRARNVILLIGDGLGDAEITLARNYALGAAGRLVLDTLPLTGACTTYAVDEWYPHTPDFVTDSAAAATAWATGHKTSNGRVSTAPGTGEALTTIVELAQENGLRTGSVTTAELTDATPAALAAHVNHRSCQGPADMLLCPQDKKAAGGPGSIAEQLIDHHVDVLLGGGRQRFEQVIDGGAFTAQTVTQSARAQGYLVVTTAGELQAAELRSAVGGAERSRKLLGLFAPADMSLEWQGQLAAPFPGSGPQICIEHVRPPHEPSLAAMTRKAIEVLDRSGPSTGWLRRRPGPGFFLQVEGASIDKRAHAADPCGQIGETVAFDAAVAVVLDYAATHPDTLVIVTGDHAHSSQIVPSRDVTAQVPGIYSRLLTPDGGIMTVYYATNAAGQRQHHTGSQVRIAAQGPQAANVVGLSDQTDLFHVMARALGLERDTTRTGFLRALAHTIGLQ